MGPHGLVGADHTWALREKRLHGQRGRSPTDFTPKSIQALDALRYLGERPPVHVGAPYVNVPAIHYPEWRMEPSSGQGCHVNEMNVCI